jgi:hypothetical protein
MKPLNMCAYVCRVDYDAAVRRWYEQQDAMLHKTPSEGLTEINKERTIRTSLKQGAT